MARNGFQRHKTADAIKWVIIFVMVFAVIGGMIALFVKLDRQTSTTKIGSEAYSIGFLDENGEYAEGDTAIYLRNAVTTDGLKCTVKKDAKVTYQLYFYDKDGKFVSASEQLSADWDGDVPETAESVRVVITPTEDADGKVSFTELWGYAEQVTVKVNR